MPEAHYRFAHETSPLVGAADSNEVTSMTHSGESSAINESGVSPDLSETKSSWYLFLLTLSIGGLQVVWSTELSNGSPYLLSLGMSKALLAFVWIAGPLTGTLVQPYIGICSDNCRISWGKRKPFMVVGGAASVVSLLALAWVRELTEGLLGVFDVAPGSDASQTVVIVLATILMYCLDFSVNTVQAGIRCFIVDNAPSHQQESANAWASRMTGLGNILGYIFGYVDLPKYFPLLGNTQFKVLCALASLSLICTLLVSCSYIKERDPRLEGPSSGGNPGLIAFFKQVFKSIRFLPPEIAKVCEVQLAAWVGWFPFLFYSTTYIGQLFVNPIFEAHPGLSEHDINKAWEEATRIGTFALLVYAIISFVANLTLPILVVPTYKPIVATESEASDDQLEVEPFLGDRRRSSSVGTAMEASTGISPEPKGGYAEGAGWLSKLQIPGLTLRRAWLMSHVNFAICMFSTFFISSYQAATVVVGLVGISWALTLWAPFALISAEVSRIDTERRLRRQRADGTVPDTSVSANPATVREDPEHGHNVTTDKGEEDANLAQAGIILGLHNVAVSAPQILSSLISSAIFKAFQKPRGEPWDDSVGWVLRFGGCATLIAAWLAHRLAEGTR